MITVKDCQHRQIRRICYPHKTSIRFLAFVAIVTSLVINRNKLITIFHV